MNFTFPISRQGILLLFLACVMSFRADAASGSLSLAVDATEAPRRLLRVKESLDVRPGPLTLCYPKWIPGEHGPTGPITDLVGMKITAQGRTVSWRRDLDDMFAFHCEVPEGTTSLDVSFEFIMSVATKGFSSAKSSTPHLLVLSWNQVVLSPQGVSPDSIRVTPRLRLPEGWAFGSALETGGTSAGEILFKSVSLTTLVDSPVLSGRYFKRLDISAGFATPHRLNIASDGAAALEIPDHLRRASERLVREANALFGAHHYQHYDFLLTLSDHVASFGLEHHQSSDNRVGERSLIDPELWKTRSTLLSHEFVHSWNGKYRRPAGLATGDFSSPMRGDLLWVYEGLTQYLGNVLGARSGMSTAAGYREHLAMTGAMLDHRPGREWRTLQDVADAAQVLYESRTDGETERRSVDFYDEGDLVWLEVDVLIREQTQGKKSLDDFCKLFFGGQDSPPQLKTYTFDDIVSALTKVVAYDWRTHLTDRLQSLSPHAPLAGIERAGWKLVYRDTLSDIMKAFESVKKEIDMRYSVGIICMDDGTLKDVMPGTPAAKGGLAPGMILGAVNGKKFSADILHDAVKFSAKSATSLEFLAQNGDFLTSYKVDYHGGELYPALERDASRPDILSQIIKPTTTIP